jgi:hypothetical protein
MTFFLKTNAVVQILKELPIFLTKNANLFANFLAKILQNS